MDGRAGRSEVRHVPPLMAAKTHPKPMLARHCRADGVQDAPPDARTSRPIGHNPRMKKPARKLTHIDPKGRPAMVDVSAKEITAREARAECRVRFPADVARQLRASGLKSAKGGIVETAIIAGTMAVKRTHELIPFCH